MSLTILSSPVETLKKEIEDTGMIDTLSNEFVQELMDYGIETVSQFEEAFHGQYQSGLSDWTDSVIEKRIERAIDRNDARQLTGLTY